jgi:DNA-binding response OmpR family regulator
MRPEDNPRGIARPQKGVFVVVYGGESENEALADELALDGYSVDLVDEPVGLKERLGSAELVIFGWRRLGSEVGALRALRMGRLASGACSAWVLWISTRGDADVLRAFDAGADDVIRASFIYPELLARVRALLHRCGRVDASDVLRCGALEIDMATRTVTFGGVLVELRRMELALLARLARDPTRVHEKHALLVEVWGFRSTGSTRTLDSHASRLRRKLARAGAEGWVCSTWGVGYRLVPDTQTATLRSA